MLPAIGQIVRYRLTPEDVAWVQSMGLHEGGQAQAQPGQPLPAIVTALPEVPVMAPILDGQGKPTGQTGPTGEMRTAVNLQILLDGSSTFWRQDVPSVDTYGQTIGAWEAIPAESTDLAGFYARQVQPVIVGLQNRIDQLDSLINEHLSTPPTPVLPITFPATPVA